MADEPIRASFSAKQAARYLDNASLNWQKRRNCVTCHTNMPYLMARPSLSDAMPDSGEVRSFSRIITSPVGKRKQATREALSPGFDWSGPAFNDAQTTGFVGRGPDDSRSDVDDSRGEWAWNWAKCGYADGNRRSLRGYARRPCGRHCPGRLCPNPIGQGRFGKGTQVFEPTRLLPCTIVS